MAGVLTPGEPLGATAALAGLPQRSDGVDAVADAHWEPEVALIARSAAPHPPGAIGSSAWRGRAGPNLRTQTPHRSRCAKYRIRPPRHRMAPTIPRDLEIERAF